MRRKTLWISLGITVTLVTGLLLWWAGTRLSEWSRLRLPDMELIMRWLPLGGAAWLIMVGTLWFLARRARESLGGSGPMDVLVGYARKPVMIPEHDRFLHTLVVGTTGTGKSTRILKPMIWQDLRRLAEGHQLGVSVIEPKGDLVADVAGMCKALGVPYILVDPERDDTARFNPLEGDTEVAAEVLRTVLTAIFGRQEAFFSLVQQGLIKYTVRILKELQGNWVSLLDVLTALTEPEVLHQHVEDYRRRGGDPLVIRFFEAEVLGKLSDKFFQFALGVRMQLGDMVGNTLLKRVLTGRSDVDLDRHLAAGGVLLVNTAMGRLGQLGDAFGQFVMLQLQYAVFRRPKPESDRTPHFLYIDEFPRYVNPDFERMLALGRSYRCATVLACQNTAQLVLDAKAQLREILIGLCRNKITLNLESEADAERFSREFGEREVQDVQWTYKRHVTGPLIWHYPESKRIADKRERRFPSDALVHLPAFHAVAKVTVDGQPQRAVLCRLGLSEFDQYPVRWRGGVPPPAPARPAAAAAAPPAEDHAPEPATGPRPSGFFPPPKADG